MRCSGGREAPHAAPIFRLADESFPAEATTYARGDRVRVWTRLRHAPAARYWPGAVTASDASRLEVRVDADGRVRSFLAEEHLEALPRDMGHDPPEVHETFSHVEPAGHCGALEAGRTWLTLYGVGTPPLLRPAAEQEQRAELATVAFRDAASGALMGQLRAPAGARLASFRAALFRLPAAEAGRVTLRAGADRQLVPPEATLGQVGGQELEAELAPPTDVRQGPGALLVGPGARCVGRWVAVRLGLLQDADESSLDGAGANGECYRFYFGALARPPQDPEEAQRRVLDAVGQCVARLLPALALLEEEQALVVACEAPHITLAGPGAGAVARHLLALYPRAARLLSERASAPHQSAQERVLLEWRGEGAQEAARAALRSARVPQGLLRSAARRDDDGREEEVGAAWALRYEGAKARNGGAAPWRCPQDAVALRGPVEETVLLARFAREQGAVNVVRHAEIMLPPERRLGYAPTLAAATAQAWSGAGEDGAQLDGNYRGHMTVRALEPHERAFATEVLRPWNPRHLKRLLEGRVARAPAGRYVALLRPLLCPPLVEHEDVRDESTGQSLLAGRGALTGLRNVMHHFTPALSLVRDKDPKIRLRATVQPQARRAFFSVELRRVHALRIRRGGLEAVRASRRLGAAIRREARVGEAHEGLERPEDGRPGKRGVDALAFCESGVPEAYALGAGRGCPAPDIEALARVLRNGSRACTGCGDCRDVLNGASPGLASMFAVPGVLTAILRTEYVPVPSPAPHAPPTAPGALAQLPDRVARAALPAAPPPLDERLLAGLAPSVAATFREASAGAGPFALETLTALSRRLAPRAAADAPEGPRGREEYFAGLAFARALQSMLSKGSDEELRHKPVRDEDREALQDATCGRPVRGADRKTLLATLRANLERSCLWGSEAPILLAAAATSAEDVDHVRAFAAHLLLAEGGGTTPSTFLPDVSELVWKRLRRHLGRADRRTRHARAMATVLAKCAPARGALYAVRLVVCTWGSPQGMGALDSPEAWGVQNLATWTELTQSWSTEDALRALEIAIAAPQPPRIVLTLLREQGCGCARTFEAAFTRARNEGAGAPALPAAPPAAAPLSVQQQNSVLARAKSQLEAPEPGSEAWEDDTSQGRHATLLFEHTTRELIGLLLRLHQQPRFLPRGLPLLTTELERDDMLLGDRAWLSGEQQDAAPVWAEDCVTSVLANVEQPGFFSAERLADTVTLGAASTTEETGNNLACRWRWRREGP